MYYMYVNYTTLVCVVEAPVVPGANTGIQPDTVVIKTTNTLVTHTAVLSTGSTKSI